MYARVSDFQVPLEKLAAFTEAAHSVIPLIHKEAGFRALLVLKTPGSPALARVVSVWESLEHLKASEKSMFLYQALSRVMAFTKGFPIMEESEVLVSTFAGAASAPPAPRTVSDEDTQEIRTKDLPR